MDQGAIVALKRLYKKAYLREFLMDDSQFEGKYFRFFKEWNLLCCIKTISTAWAHVSQDNLSKAWNNLLGRDFQCNNSDNVAEITDLVTRAFSIPFSVEETIQRLDNDKYDHGWEPQDINEIIAAMTNSNTEII